VEIEGAHRKEGREPRENSDLKWKEKKGRASKLCSMTYVVPDTDDPQATLFLICSIEKEI
jgi:hypothetical protein